MKKFKQSLFLKQGNDPNRVIPKRVLRALRIALNQELLSRKISVNVEPFFTAFSKQVFIDTHGFEGERGSTGELVNVKMYAKGSVSPGPYVMIHVFIRNYLPGVNEGHAIMAFKYQDVLYCFNPWGHKYILTNQRTHKVLPDDIVWDALRVMYGCSSAMIYTGKSYQDNDKIGACVGLSADFGVFMYSQVMFEAAFPEERIPIPKPSTAVERIGNLMYSSEYNAFVETLITVSIGAFRNSLSTCNLNKNVLRVAERLHYNEHVVSNQVNTKKNYFRKSEPNLLNVFNRVVNKDVVFRNYVTALGSRDERVSQQARKFVRDRLRQENAQIARMHGNRINANIQRYINSGDINLSTMKNRNVYMRNA